MLELVLSDETISPRVELLDGPRVRLTISASEDLSSAIEFCALELSSAVQKALHQLHDDDSASARVFIRENQGNEIITTTDPCTSYGLDSIVRP